MLQAAATNHEVVLLTQADQIDGVRASLGAASLGPVELVAVAGPVWLERFEGRLGLGHLAYLVWQYRAWKRGRHLQHRVDVAHHVTFANDWLPSAVHFLARVPVVWGPVGGASPIPWRLARYLSVKGLAREVIRETLTRCLRLVTARLVDRRRCLIVAVNKDTAGRFEAPHRHVVVEPHVAMAPSPCLEADSHPDKARREHAQSKQKSAVFAARLASWKGIYLALQTLYHLPSPWHLDVYGEGSELKGVNRRAQQLGITDRVRICGHRPVEELRAALTTADVLLFPSMHDASPFTVAEAVRVGCPVVCLDVGGPPLLVAGTTGRAVALSRDAPRRLAAAVLDARRHAPDDRWNADRLAGKVTSWYDQALAIPFPATRKVAGR